MDEIISHVQKDGVILLENIPVNDENKTLIDLSLSLGIPTEIDSKYPYVENEFVHIVKSQNTPVINQWGYPIISTTEQEFRLHTDEYNSIKPADYILLQCIEPDCSGGGISLVYHVEELLNDLPVEIVKALHNSLFPYSRGLTSVLYENNDKTEIRFNSVDIYASYLKRGEKIPVLIKELVEFIDNVSRINSTKFSLVSGNCLIIDNKRVLHGRTAFSNDSVRIFKRVRLYKL